MINLQYNTENRILFADYIGVIDNNDILKFYDNLSDYRTLSSSLLILQTETEASFVNSEKIISTALEKIKLLLKEFEYIKVAVIQTEEIKTAYSLIFENEARSIKNYYIKIFTTRDAALWWLNF